MVFTVYHFMYVYSLFAPDCEYDSLQKVASQLQFNFFDEVVVNITRVSKHTPLYIMSRVSLSTVVLIP